MLRSNFLSNLALFFVALLMLVGGVGCPEP